MKKLNLVLGMMLAGATSMATADSLYVNADGLIGVGTNDPKNAIHIINDVKPTLYKIEHLNPEKVRFAMKNPNATWTFDMTADGKSFLISKVGQGAMLEVTDAGVLKIGGTQVYP